MVDFRATEFLRAEPGRDTAPLIYPGRLRHGRVLWPMAASKKPNALLNVPGSADLMVPEGLYVLTKRFSSKEERRRIVATLYDPADVASGPVGFENHLNYYHARRPGLGPSARARTSGVPQLDFDRSLFPPVQWAYAGQRRRSLEPRYPFHHQLRKLGEIIGEQHLEQSELDRLIDRELFMVDSDLDPVRIRHRVEESITVLRQDGFPRAQLNERSALTLLALLNLGPGDEWARCREPAYRNHANNGLHQRPLRQDVCPEHSRDCPEADSPPVR